MTDIMEKDIEDAFREYLNGKDCHEFIGQQVRVRVGIVDLLYYWEKFNRPVVVEVKRGKAPKDALAQLMAYMACVDEAITDDLLIAQRYSDNRKSGLSLGLLVAKSFDRMTLRALFNSPNIIYYRYEITDEGISFISYVDDLIAAMHRTRNVHSGSAELQYLVGKVRKKLVSEQIEKEHNLVNNPGGHVGHIVELCDSDGVIRMRNG